MHAPLALAPPHVLACHVRCESGVFSATAANELAALSFLLGSSNAHFPLSLSPRTYQEKRVMMRVLSCSPSNNRRVAQCVAHPEVAQ